MKLARKIGMKTPLVICSLILCSSVTALGATSAPKASPATAESDANEALPAGETAPAYSAEFEKLIMEEWAKIERKPASAQVFEEKDLEADFVTFRDAFIAASTADRVEELIKKGTANYASYSTSTKFFIAQLTPLLKLRGIVWRLRPIFEHDDGKFAGRYYSGTRASHSMAVSLVRSLASMQKIYLPIQNWDALFAFLTIPSSRMGLGSQFHNMTQFQDYIAQNIIPSMEFAAKRVREIVQSKPAKPAIWDNKMIYGKGAFDDGIRRYVGFALPEMLATLAGIHLSMHSIKGFVAYDQGELLHAMESQGKMMGIDGFDPGQTLGITSKDRRDRFVSFRKKGFLQLRTRVSTLGSGKALMAQSFEDLKSYVGYMNMAFDGLQKRPDGTESLVINPIYFKDSVNPDIRTTIKEMKQLITKSTPVKSALTGDIIQVDLPSFYANPPEDLLALLPTKFEGGKEEFTVRGVDGNDLHYRNYFVGRAIGWDTAAWEKLLPGIKSAKYDVATAMRALKTADGTNLVTLPMSPFVQ